MTKKIMFFLILILFLLVWRKYIKAQHTFELLIENNSNEDIFSTIEGYNDNFIMFGLTVTTIEELNQPDAYTALFLSLSYDGEILLRKEIPDFIKTPGQYRKKIIQTPDSNYLVCSSYTVNFNNPDSVYSVISLNKFDKDFNLIWTKNHKWWYGYYFVDNVDVTIHPDGNIIVIGNYMKDFPWFSFFYMFTQNGDSLKSVTYESNDNTPLEVWNIHVRNNPDTPYLVTAIWFDQYDNILEVDNDLNITKIHNFTNYEPEGYHDICPGFSSKYFENKMYISGWTCGSLNVAKYQIGAFSTDEDFNLSDIIIFGTANHDIPAPSGAIDIKDTSKIYIGGRVDLGNKNWFILNQCNSKLESNWIKYYGGDASYYLSQIIATDDGGCLLIGTRSESGNPKNIYIIKVDSNGMLTKKNNKIINLE